MSYPVTQKQTEKCRGLCMSGCMHVPSGVRALQHPHPGPHILQLPCDIQRYATSTTHQDAGIVWTHLSLHRILPAPLLASAHAASTKHHGSLHHSVPLRDRWGLGFWLVVVISMLMLSSCDEVGMCRSRCGLLDRSGLTIWSTVCHVA